MLRLRKRDQSSGAEPGAVAVARQQANRATDAELALRRHQQHRAGWLENNAALGSTYHQVVRTLAWQSRAAGLAQEAIEQDRPQYVRDALGPVPESTRGRRAWRQAAGAIMDYRSSYHVTEPDRALGPAPRDPAQRAAWQHAHGLVERVHGKQRGQHDRHLGRQQANRPAADREHIDLAQPTNRNLPGGRRGPERAAG